MSEEKKEKLNVWVIFIGSLVLYLLVYRFPELYFRFGLDKILPNYVYESLTPFFSFLTGLVTAIVYKKRALTHAFIIGLIVHQLYLYSMSYFYPIINIHSQRDLLWMFVLLLETSGAAFVGAYVGKKFSDSEWR